MNHARLELVFKRGYLRAPPPAVTLSMLGGLLGIGLGMAIGTVAAKLIPGFPADAHTPLWAVLVAVGFSGFVGVAFGTYPAAKAASLDPIESLRYE